MVHERGCRVLSYNLKSVQLLRAERVDGEVDVAEDGDADNDDQIHIENTLQRDYIVQTFNDFCSMSLNRMNLWRRCFSHLSKIKSYGLGWSQRSIETISQRDYSPILNI